MKLCAICIEFKSKVMRMQRGRDLQNQRTGAAKKKTVRSLHLTYNYYEGIWQMTLKTNLECLTRKPGLVLNFAINLRLSLFFLNFSSHSYHVILLR